LSILATKKRLHKRHERSSSDIIQPILKRLENHDQDAPIDASTIISLRSELRLAYKVVRELEKEVSCRRWNEMAELDVAINRQHETMKQIRELDVPNLVILEDFIK